MLLLMGAVGPAIEARAALSPGDAAPDLTGFELDGKLPARLRGKVLVLDFWASWCGPCARSFPVLDALQKQHGHEMLEVIAVSVDEKAGPMETFLKKHPVSFAVVRDARQKLVAKADVKAMPTTFVIDRKGKVRFVHSGFDEGKTQKELGTQIETLLKEKYED